MNRYSYQISRKRDMHLLVWMCTLSYAITYIGRLNYSAALPVMIEQGILEKTWGGMIATAYFGAYGVGQLINGCLADHFNPRTQVLVGVSGSAVLNLVMGTVAQPQSMLLVWGLNGYAQSLIWAPMFLIVSQSIPEIFRMRALLLLNSAPSIGTVLAYLVSSVVLKIASWQWLFIGAALLLLVCTGCWLLGWRVLQCHGAPQEAQMQTTQKNRYAQTRKPLPKAAWKGIGVGMVLLVLPAMIHGMLKDGVTSWLPTYMTEEFSMAAETAVAFSVLLPLINIFGAAIGYWMIARLRNEAACVCILFAGSGFCMLLLTAAGNWKPILAVVLFALVTAAMMAVNVLLCSEVPARFAASGLAGTVSGFFNACGYIGTSVSMYGIAWIAESCGWGAMRTVWLVSCLIAAALCGVSAPLWRRKPSGR